MTKTHWNRHDFRIESLTITISGLEKSIIELREKLDEIEWYDGLWLLEESEPVYGLVFIALQNYINSSIYDRFENLEKQYLMYKLGRKINDTERTDIELIISLANYFKHRDQPKMLFPETQKILNDFSLRFEQDVDIENSPIFKGLDLFTANWNIFKLIDTVKEWREKLWIDENNTNHNTS